VLTGKCGVVAGDPCELRIDAAGRKFASAELSAGDRDAGVTATGKQDGDHLRVVLSSPTGTREVEWTIRFADGAK
jgi:hypothetical protein